MNDKTEKLLRKDSLAESEEILGNKHWSEFNRLEQEFSIFKSIRDNEIKREHLKSIGDTYYGIEWGAFINLIEQHGFKEGLKYDFIAPKYNAREKDRIEQAILYYHPIKGLIIWATSHGNHINSGKVHGMAKYNEWEDVFSVLTGSNGDNGEDENIRYFDFDIREGLIHNINKVDNNLKLLPQWRGRLPFLWFLDYAEEKQPNYDYKVITAKKIAKCPKEMQDIISGCKTR